MSATEERTWEYRTIAETADLDLNALGRDGWELVGVAGAGETARLYFKRPGPDFREQVTLDQKRRYYQLQGLPLPREEARDK